MNVRKNQHMNIRAIFFDIDGTLVSMQEHGIPASTLEAVHEVRQRGIQAFIATGRPLPFIDNLGEMEYDGIISFTGAHCMLRNGETICKKSIDQEDLHRMVAFCQKHKMPVAFTSPERAFLTCHNEESLKVYEALQVPLLEMAPAEEALKMDVLEIIAFFTEQEEPQLMHDVLPHCAAHRWHPSFADVIASGNSKATGIDAVIQHLGIRLEETMAFGDGGNDIEMLQHVALGVAMGNANEYVKSQADYVTDSVDQDGVAKAIRKFIC